MIYEIIIYCEVLGIEYATFCLYYYSNRRHVPVFPLLYIIGKNAKNLLKTYTSKFNTITKIKEEYLCSYLC